MSIEDRDALAVGQKLVARYKGTEYETAIVDRGEGKLGFEYGGTVYTSPSSAGSAVMGGTACNGWRFWTPEGQLAPAREAKPKAEKGEKVAKAPKAKGPVKLIKKIPNQKGVVEGSVKYYCSTCQNSFVVEGTEFPTTCPEGHPATAIDDFEVDEGPSPLGTNGTSDEVPDLTADVEEVAAPA